MTKCYCEICQDRGLASGDHVGLANVRIYGVVEYADHEQVRVRWDDGQVGLLHYDDSALPNASYLLKLVGGKDKEGA